MKHISSTPLIHEISDLLLSQNMELEICDICKSRSAKVNCLCQDEKKKFCQECISIHLDINTSHCIEPIENKAFTREILKYQEKRRKIEYLLYEVQRNKNILQDFKNILKKSKQELLSQLNTSTQDIKNQVNKSKIYLHELYDNLQAKTIPSNEEEQLAEILINKTDSENLEKVDKHMNLIEIKHQADNALKSIKNCCKFSFFGVDIKNR